MPKELEWLTIATTMDFQRIKLFYLETWWLWTLYLVGCFAATYFISVIFLSVLPILLAISLYFAIIRGPSTPMEGDDDESESVDDEKASN